VDEVTVLLKGRVIFKQYVPKKYKCLGIKIYKFCNITNIHRPLAECIFCNENGWESSKPVTVEGNRQHMGYVSKVSRMTNRYSLT
jgi:hypothetical protein